MGAIRRLAAADRDRAGELWRAVELAAGPPRFATGWEWTSLWLEHFGDLVPHEFLIVEDAEGVPCGATLLTHGASRSRVLPVRSLHLGTAGVPKPDDVYVECNRLLARPGSREEVARALIQELSGQSGWDELALDGFVAADAELLAATAPALHLRAEPSPYAELTTLAERGGGDLVAGLGRNTRQQVRRSARELGDLQHEVAADADAALAVFDELIQLHQARWLAAREPGAFASGRVVAFHRELIRRRAPDGALLFRVEAAGRTVACLYSHVEDGVAFFYQGGFAQASGEKVRPGLLAHSLCMSACLERGITEYDFLGGEGRYKRQLSTAERTLYWGTLRRGRLRPLLRRLRRA